MDVQVVEPGRLDDVGAAVAADWLAGLPGATLLAAVGTSPLGVYAGMARLCAAGGLDLAGVRLVQLDEYVGVPDDDRRSLYGWLRRDVAKPLGVGAARILRLAGDAPDPTAEAGRHDAAIAAAGGLDVSILGLGPNGHLGFNEPPSGPGAPARVVELADASLRSNARYWGSRSAVPRRAMTVGMDRLLAARHTLLVVRGATKRAVLRRFVAEPVDDDLPASHLRTVSGAMLLADSDAWPADLAVPARLGACGR
jgi:glucosamine-6-phosphate deaminase